MFAWTPRQLSAATAHVLAFIPLWKIDKSRLFNLSFNSRIFLSINSIHVLPHIISVFFNANFSRVATEEGCALPWPAAKKYENSPLKTPFRLLAIEIVFLVNGLAE
jgi:hypothetical protein